MSKIGTKATKKIVQLWHDIPGFEKQYKVSNKGRVRRLEFRTKNLNGVPIHFRERILKGTLHDNHTVAVRLFNKKTFLWERHSVHNLIRAGFPSIDEWRALDLAEDEQGGEVSESKYRNLQTWVTHGVAAKKRPVYKVGRLTCK